MLIFSSYHVGNINPQKRQYRIFLEIKSILLIPENCGSLDSCTVTISYNGPNVARMCILSQKSEVLRQESKNISNMNSGIVIIGTKFAKLFGISISFKNEIRMRTAFPNFTRTPHMFQNVTHLKT